MGATRQPLGKYLGGDMKIKEIYKTTDNRSVLKKAYREFIAREERICGICGYHRGENADRKRRDRRNWKRYRKAQWKYQE
jgi:hypothetical protein